MLSFDTETRGLTYHEDVQSVFMVQWADAYGEYVCDENTGWQPFLDAIAQEQMLVAANASFDVHHLHASGVVDLLSSGHRVHDVQTLARVAIPGRWSYKLESLGTDLLGKGATKAQHELKEHAHLHKCTWTSEDKDYYGLWKFEPELMERYGKEDVRLTYDLWQHIWPRASDVDREVYRMEIAGVAPILRSAERHGVLVDPERRDELKARLLQERNEYRSKLLASGISEAALGSDDASASTKALLADLLTAGVPLYRMTPKGKSLAVDKDSLKEFEGSHPVISDLLAWRARNKTLSTYITALEQADPRIHTSFNQCEARTSRMSASRPNVQNLPTTKGVRDVLIPASGNAFVVADFEGIEVRVLAYYLGNQELIAALDDGLDMHQLTAQRVAQALGDPGAKFEDFVKGGPRGKERDRAKTTTFRTLYGGGARLTSVQLGIPMTEAAALVAAVKDVIPGYAKFDAAVQRKLRQRSYVKTILGRRLAVPKDKKYIGLNRIIQGSSAEIMKLAMIAAAPVLEPLGYQIVLVVHDELVAEGPDHLADEALAAMIIAMEGCYPLRPKLVATGSHSIDSYGDAKS